MDDLFQKKAQDWDIQTIPQQLSQNIGPALISRVKLHSQMEVLDFGAGTGLLSAHVVPLVKNITAVDISEAMLERLVAKAELKNKVTTFCQDILHQPLEKEFDLIISAMAMHHVEDTLALLKSFARHLKPGASIALADLDAENGSFHPEGTEGVYHLGFNRESFTQLLTNAGFGSIEFITAYTVKKDDAEFPIFLVTAKKQ